MKKKQRISDLFYDNRFLLVFSVVVAAAFWLFATVELGVETEENVTQTVDLSAAFEQVEDNLNLHAFGVENEIEVEITVSGKKYIVNSDAVVNDIEVLIDTSNITSAGNGTLYFNVNSKDDNLVYDVIDISPDKMNIYFDYYGEKDLVIEPEIEFNGVPAQDGYIIGEYFLPDESSRVKVTGPASEVNKISRVVARARVNGNLKENKNVDAELVALTESGEIVQNNIDFGKQSKTVKVTLPVYKIATLPLSCKFANSPLNYVVNMPFNVEVSPLQALVGVPEKKLEGMSTLDIKTIDFSALNKGVNVFTVNATDVEDVEFLDDTQVFTVTVTVNDVISETFQAPKNIEYMNVPEGVNAETDISLIQLDFTDITVIGPEASVNSLDYEKLTLSADLSNIVKDTKGDFTVPVSLMDDDCWIYGEYTAEITII